MKIKINGDEKKFDLESLTISKLLELEQVKMPEMVSVEHNGEMVEREQFESTQIKENDVVEFLYFMGGGRYAG